jgi:steroid 5-alpha reductase family enzyme
LAASVIWGVRLAAYVTWRNHGKGEDPRYRDLLAAAKGNRNLYALRSVYLLQALTLWVACLPIQAGMLERAPAGPLTAVGGAVWLGGFVFESVGDWQLARFKADRRNHGLIMDQGLWRYTRHPNYFGDFCMWWGLFLISLGSVAELPTIIGPLLMTFILTRGTGQRMTDRRMAASRPQYADYAARTSGFIPLPPRRSVLPNGPAFVPPRPQPQLGRERRQVRLLGQPGQRTVTGVVAEQRHRHAKRHLTPPVGLDPGHQVVPPYLRQRPADPAVGVLQRVDVPPWRTPGRHRGQEQLPVRRARLPGRDRPRARHHPSGRTVPARIVREQLQLVPGVEGHQAGGLQRPGEQRAQPRRGEQPLHERLTQSRVVQPSFVLHGQQRVRRHDPPGVQAGPGRAGRVPAGPVPRDAPHPAARRLGLEHVPVNRRGQRQGRHGPRVVRGPAPVDQAALGVQPDRLPRGAEPDLDLRAVRHPVHVGAELVGQEAVPLVAAVEPHFRAEQAA